MPVSRSRPIYQEIPLGRLGRRDLLLLGSGIDVPSAALPEDTACWVLDRDFPSIDDMAAALSERLEHAQVGQRIFIKGSEAFVWRMAQVGLASGLQERDISMEECGAIEKPVVCIACRTTAISRSTDDGPIDCACGLRLVVADHFSRRLGAYLGIPL